MGQAATLRIEEAQARELVEQLAGLGTLSLMSHRWLLCIRYSWPKPYPSGRRYLPLCSTGLSSSTGTLLAWAEAS